MATPLEECVVKKRSRRITIRKNLSTQVDSLILEEVNLKCQKRHGQLYAQELVFAPLSSPENNSWNIRKPELTAMTDWATSPLSTVIEKRTSTPCHMTRPSRFSEVLEKEVSPISQHSKNGINSSHRNCTTLSPNKLGKPLLSSTKIHAQLDNDRLINAARIYKNRLQRQLSDSESEMVTSQLLHKNAIVDSFASPNGSTEETNQQNGIWNT